MMARRAQTVIWGLMAGCCVVAAMVVPVHSAHAQSGEAPDIAYCNAMPEDPEVEELREELIALPADWKGFAVSSFNWIAVKTEYDTTYCVDTAWMADAANFERFGERFLGFQWDGFEAFGYVLIDRARQGRQIDTGARPVFSPDGSSLAALQKSDANWRGFEGFAIWHTHGGLLEPYIVNPGPPLEPMWDWRIDRWEGENCLHISAVPYERFGGDWESLPSQPRDRYIASPANDWQIIAGETCPA